MSWMMGKERVVLYHLTLLHLVWKRRMNAIEFDTGYCLLYVDVYLMERALVLKGARVDELGFGGCTPCLP